MKALMCMACGAVTALSACAGGSNSSSGATSSSSSSSGSAAVGAPVLTSAMAQVGGRHGGDLLVQVEGSDSAKDAAYLWVKFMDANGGAVAAADLDHNGTMDSEGLTALPTTVRAQLAFSASVDLAGVISAPPQVAKVTLAVVDALQQRSADLTVDVTAQPVKTLGQPCDSAHVADHCEVGLHCGGTPVLCQPGVAPELTRFAFIRDAAGPHILMEGTEPDDDMGDILLEFLDAAGQPMSVDLDGDDVPESTSFTQDARTSMLEGAFFVGMQSAIGFDTLVGKLAATPSDVNGHTGLRKVAALTNPTPKGAGQECSLRGFDACAAGQVCTTRAGSAVTTCQLAATVRTAMCTTAPVLDPVAGPMTVSGQSMAGSLWDAPVGCVSADPKGRPDGLVRLHLAAPVAVLTLTTELPGTDFDTNIYVLTGCAVDSSAPLGCNDDITGTSASTLVLTNVPSGDYTVVVDSFTASGGSFTLGVSVQ